jgi:hypothetical protein
VLLATGKNKKIAAWSLVPQTEENEGHCKVASG